MRNIKLYHDKEGNIDIPIVGTPIKLRRVEYRVGDATIYSYQFDPRLETVEIAIEKLNGWLDREGK